MIFRYSVSLLAFLTLSACVTYPDISQSRSPCRTEPGGWCSFVREAAVDAYPFAIASLQAYANDYDVYTGEIPMLEPLRREDIDPEAVKKGFGYELFALYEPGTSGDSRRKPIARILAFRGTDFDGFTDIFYGTLRNDQIDLAKEAFAKEKARFDESVPWIVTGHSLGGALATEVSIANPEVRAYMFNTSPFYGGDDMTNDMQRTVFNERGEILRRFARYDESPAADVFTLNCGPRNNTFTKHRIRLLADCLTWIAAYENQDAFDMIEAHKDEEIPIRKPMVECRREREGHPGVGWQEPDGMPCIHLARPPEDDRDN